MEANDILIEKNSSSTSALYSVKNICRHAGYESQRYSCVWQVFSSDSVKYMLQFPNVCRCKLMQRIRNVFRDLHNRKHFMIEVMYSHYECKE